MCCGYTTTLFLCRQVDYHRSSFPYSAGKIYTSLQVFYAGKTSMEVQVTVVAENPLSGRRELTTDALLTFVAIDSDGKPTAIEPLYPVSA